VRGLLQKEANDYRTVIYTAGESVSVLDPTSRTIRARVDPLTAEELANCMEQYNLRLHVAAADFPTTNPDKGLIVIVRGVRRGVMAVREQVSNDLRLGWVLECKG